MIVKNYLADLPRDEKAALYALNFEPDKSSSILTQDNDIDLDAVMKTNHLPVLILEDGRATSSKKGETIPSDNNEVGRLPTRKDDFRYVKAYFWDPLNTDEDGNHLKDIGVWSSEESERQPIDAVIYGQGTSSMQYPVKNLRFRIKKSSDAYSLFPNVPAVQLFTMKADYMDSSMAHNAGTANLLQPLYDAQNMVTPPQQYYKAHNRSEKILSNMMGRPILIFFKAHDPNAENAPYTYIGRYNFMLDKGEPTLFGFKSIVDEEHPENSFGVVLNDNGTLCETYEAIEGAAKEYKDGKTYYIYDPATKTYEEKAFASGAELEEVAQKQRPVYVKKTGANSIYCVEFRDNRRALAGFRTMYDEAADCANNYNEWCQAFESRYPDYKKQPGADKRGWTRVLQWVASTDNNKVPPQAWFDLPDNEWAANINWNAVDNEGNRIIPPYLYETKEEYRLPATAWNGTGSNAFTYDCKEYRNAKFKAEFENYFVKDFTIFYYIITETLLMIDSRAKNMMMVSFDVNNEKETGHWYPIFYDMDTSLGLNNIGTLKFPYDTDDTDPGVYNAVADWDSSSYSVLWCHIRELYQTDIQAMYNSLRSNGIFNYQAISEFYNKNEADMFSTVEINRDHWYKYIRPLTTKTEVMEEDGSFSYKTYDGTNAAQGTRSLHRDYWLNHRFNYLDSKYASVTKVKSNWDISMRAYGGTNVNAASAAAVPPKFNFTFLTSSTQYGVACYGEGNNESEMHRVKVLPNVPTELRDPGANVQGESTNESNIYLMNLGDIYDIGDLSPFYTSDLKIQYTLKLRKLIVGNSSPAYKNDRFSFEDGVFEKLPYLEELNVEHIEPTDEAVDLSPCKYLRTVKAKDSKFTSFIFPSGAAIERLELPATLNELKLYSNLFFDTKTDPDNLQIQSCRALASLEVADCPLLDTKRIVAQIKNDQRITYTMTGSYTLEEFNLPDVEWTFDINDCVVNNGIIEDVELLEFLRLIPNQKVTDNHNFGGTVVINNSDTPCDEYAIATKYAQRYPDLKISYSNPAINIHSYAVNFHDATGNKLTGRNGYTNSFDLTVAQISNGNSYDLLSYIPTNVMRLATETSGDLNYVFKGWATDEMHECEDATELAAVLANGISVYTETDSYLTPTLYNAANPEDVANYLPETLSVKAWTHDISDADQGHYELVEPDGGQPYYLTYRKPGAIRVIANKTYQLTTEDFDDAQEFNLYPIRLKEPTRYEVRFYNHPQNEQVPGVDDQNGKTQYVPVGTAAQTPANEPSIMVLDPDDLNKVTVQSLKQYSTDYSMIYANTDVYPVWNEAKDIHEEVGSASAFEVTPVNVSYDQDHGISYSAGVSVKIKADYKGRALVVPYAINGSPVVALSKCESTTVERIFFAHGPLDPNTSAYTPHPLERIGASAFAGNSTLQWIDLASGSRTVEDDIDGHIWYSYQYGTPNLKTIGDQAFDGTDNRNSSPNRLAITNLPDHLMIIGQKAFAHNYELALTNLPSALVSLGMNAFNSCHNLRDVRWELTKRTILPGADQYLTIDQSAFYNCENLRFVYHASDEPITFEGVDKINANAFQGCTRLLFWNYEVPTNITDPLAINEWLASRMNTSLTAVGRRAFYDCPGVQYVTNWPLNLTDIDEAAFAHNITNNEFGVAPQGSTNGRYILSSIYFPALRKAGKEILRGCTAGRIDINSNNLIAGEFGFTYFDDDTTEHSLNANMFDGLYASAIYLVAIPNVNTGASPTPQETLAAHPYWRNAAPWGASYVGMGYTTDPTVDTYADSEWTTVRYHPGIYAGLYVGEYQFDGKLPALKANAETIADANGVVGGDKTWYTKYMPTTQGGEP